jgi:polyphenol oxidase
MRLFAGQRVVGNGQSVRIGWTDRHCGDFSLKNPSVAQLRIERFGALPVVAPQQVHGTRVATAPDDFLADEQIHADAIVTSELGQVLSILTADCAPIALWTETGTIAAVHAGWRGLLDGVVDQTVREMRNIVGAHEPIHGWLGPCIHVECYEFGGEDLRVLTNAFGEEVRGETELGAKAFDLPRAVSRSFAQNNIRETEGVNACTACNVNWYSWRARKDTGRQALFVWQE